MHYEIKPGQGKIVTAAIDRYREAMKGVTGEEFKALKRAFFKDLIPRLDKIIAPEMMLTYDIGGITRDDRESCYVGPNVSIERDVSIGENVIFEGNNYIHAGTSIGNNVLIQANTVIGGEAYSHEYIDGKLVHLPHIGGVIIGDDVVIGSCVCIDRGLLGRTILCTGCRIDNLVHIAHDVVVGTNALVVACAMIGGRVVIGNGAWIAPNSSIKNGITVGTNSMVGLHACVLNDVPDDVVVYGVPAKEKK